jgi:hypothetical protein
MFDGSNPPDHHNDGDANSPNCDNDGDANPPDYRNHCDSKSRHGDICGCSNSRECDHDRNTKSYDSHIGCTNSLCCHDLGGTNACELCNKSRKYVSTGSYSCLASGIEQSEPRIDSPDHIQHSEWEPSEPRKSYVHSYRCPP